MSDMQTGGFRQSVAMEIRVLMLRRGVRAVTIAQKMGKSEAYMSRRLNGETALDLDDLEAIASALDVPITDLFPRERRVTETYPTGAGVAPASAVARIAPLPVQMPRLAPASPTRTGRTGR